MPQPSNQDIQPPFDPTGYPQISGAQLLQLVAGSTPYVSVGFNIYTIDLNGVPAVPNVNLTPKWQRYLWIRIITNGANVITGINLYYWNPAINPDATFLNWQSVIFGNLPAGSVGNAQLQANSVADINIISMSYAKLIGAPASFTPSGPAGGHLNGNYPNPTINPPIGAQAVITPTMLVTPPATPGAMLRLDAGSTPNWVQNGTVQRLVTTIAGQKLGNVGMTAGNPAVGEGTQIASINITPVTTANSVIRVSLAGMMAPGPANGCQGVYALFAGATLLTFLTVSASTNGVAGVQSDSASYLEAYITSAAFGAAQKAVSCRFGIGAGGTSAQFGLANGQSVFTVEEFFCFQFNQI